MHPGRDHEAEKSVVKDVRRNFLFGRQQRAHDCIQVCPDYAFRPAQAIHRFEP